jgi:glycosyltransferase involved in cell wall biosynthesis
MLAPQAREIFDFYEEYKEANSIIRQKIIKDTVMRFKPDIVFYSLIHDVPLALRSVPSRPPVVQLMLSELDDTKSGYVSNSVEAVTTSSRAMARNRLKDMRIPEETVFPIWNAVDPKRLANAHSLRKSLGIPLRSLVVGMVGNLNNLKRPLAGLESFSRVRHSNSHMVFAGNSADLGQQVEQRSRELGLTEFVHILGLVDNVHDVYRTLDIMLNCSVSEGLPMSIIEAMFMSVPVIATSVGGTPELIIHGETGYLYEVDRLDLLDRHLKRLINHSDLRKEMGIKARNRARSQFHIDIMAEAYMDLIHRHTISGDQIACSVVMPVYNGGKKLDDAIWSVRKQSYPYFEFIIVDDGSDDKSADIIMKHMAQDDRIRMFRQPHMGIVRALNKGIEESRTDMIARADADDHMLPDRLQIQMDYMNENPDIDVCGGQMLGVSKDGVPTGLIAVPLTHEEIQQAMYNSNPLSHPSVIYRKKAWEDAGGYKGDGRAEDYQLWVDMMVNGSKFANIDVPLVRYTHSHADDQPYGNWVNSVVPRIQADYAQRMQTRG